MRFAQDLYGSISTQEKGNLTQALLTQRKPSVPSSVIDVSRNRYMWDRVTVSISIGRWQRSWKSQCGCVTLKDSSAYVIQRDWQWMWFGLRIWHRYCERREPTTERV